MRRQKNAEANLQTRVRAKLKESSRFAFGRTPELSYSSAHFSILKLSCRYPFISAARLPTKNWLPL